MSFASVICALHLVAAPSPQRIKSEISDAERFVLTGHVRPSLVYAKDQGAVSESLDLNQMTIHFAMSPSQKADLQQLITLQQTRHSSQFHQWLTPEQYADRFGMNPKDIEKVTVWLESQGFSNIQAARGRGFITFSGNAGQAQQAFHTSIHHFVSADGVTHYANVTDPEFPKALSGMVETIRGLHDFTPKPHAHPHLTSSATGNHFLVPDDWETIYDVKKLYTNGVTGSGRTIAVAGQVVLANSDIEAFQTAIGLPIKDPTIVQVPNLPPPGTNSGDLGESDLDVEWAGAVAPGATVVFVTSRSVLDAESYAVDQNLADVLSITYGDCEASEGTSGNSFYNSLFQQAATEGMTVIAASGDQGAADCDSTTATYSALGLAVDLPGSSPYVTSAGGTEFTEGTATGATQYWYGTNDASQGSAISYIPETGWNDTAADGVLTASGGGASTLNTKPSFQAGPGVPADGARDVPDIAVTASADQNGYLICSGGSCVVGLRAADPTGGCAAQSPALPSPCGAYNVTGGTSAAAPTISAVVALLDQKIGTRQGWINPNIYVLGSQASNAFHDITTGSNLVPCRSTSVLGCNASTGTLGYSAGVGYDQVTGWGSIDAYNLVSDWNNDFKLTPSASSLSIAPGASGTATITVAPIGTFNGNVTFTCAVSSNVTATTCSIPGTVSGGSGSVTLTVTAGSTAKTPWFRGLRVPWSGPTNDMLLCSLAALLLATGIYLMSKQRRLQIAGFAFTMMLVVGLSSCGGGSSSSSGTGTTVSPTPTPSTVTGTVTVTATSGSLVNTTTITLTIT